MRTGRMLFILIFLCILSATGEAVGGASADGQMGRHIDSAFDRALEESGAPGGIVGVWKGNFAWIKAKGIANVQAGTPMKASYVWRIGSVTKTFVATAALRLCQKKLMSLDDRLAKYRPDFPKAEQITIRQLLQHSSGVFTWDEDDKTREAVFKHSDEQWDPERMIALAAGKSFYFQPGNGWHYSNVGYFLLSPIIEQVTGKNLAQVIRDEITTPLGLTHTYMPEGPRYKEEIIHGYMMKNGSLIDINGLKFADCINYDLAHAAGGMVSTLEDQKVWVQALASGRVLSNAMHKEQFRTISSSPSHNSGYGLGVSETQGWIGHNGGVAGSACNVYVHPATETVIITYFNKLDAFDVKQNKKELQAYTKLLMELARIVSPEKEGVGDVHGK